MLRMLFEKTGNGIWISHLDLMRVFQRAFRRAGLTIRHTQGYNPHAFVSIALPLPVGMASHCELLEFELGSETAELAALPALLNPMLPDGIRCLEAYEGGTKIRELAFIRAQVILEYDAGVPANAIEKIEQLFAADSIVVEKRSKKGPLEINIRPMIRSLRVQSVDPQTLQIEAVVCAQNPSLNPELLAKAISVHLPEVRPDFSKSVRLEILDSQMGVFR